MIFSNDQLYELSQLAFSAAHAAGHIIETHRQTKIQFHHKESSASLAGQVVTEVDHKAQAAILEILEPSRAEYDLALLTEESPDDGQRQEKPAFWCIDPLDGTLAFINNTPGFSVSIALVARNGDPLIGVAYDPVEQVLFHAIRGQGAYKNGHPIQIPDLDPKQPLILSIDFSFQSHPWLEHTRTGLHDIARQLGLDGSDIQFRTGGVMNACGILEDPNICYFKYPRSDNSGGSLWDYAATACLFHEAGAVASDIYGHPMELNRPDSTFMNHRGLLYAAHQALADRIIALHHSVLLHRKAGRLSENAQTNFQ
ncbi:3'(2'),5'-bisphosphate nucleotidase CysQ family protein [endosymbiont of Ridgeia piscesae]|jgi:3'(2'), 5'-bisphosphate nucleotidase/myo-inositol-1(or 4)-monophosphatase|uniref:Archaeal fructose-1,6-bisphosphatase or related enzyme of inositol monophosphatase family n=1 Tax=endosymbiont of Ridgeia piscesae TaxID=54398 RepID=A0A0T5Z0A5_9GAMM|nr:inositol monophosphatase family protein [endosymbiont of Ridgeia piscesae]KRT56097.1 Archaeal fructose-1,6-bisphosphatase or related enzyme of inositol monophosphatase family [endosymbiont of Ridgeia piscesae]KRT59930.1 myo-inositol-1(or 4)-monophosphatase [endosymbiont of Ridgeia piscesae]